MSVYIGSDEPVLLNYSDSLIRDLTAAILKTNTDVEITRVAPLDSTLPDGSKFWTAVFDPEYFEPDINYKIEWIGTNQNGAPYSFVESGISVKVSTDFYSTFIHDLRLSLMDDGDVVDYPIKNMLAAVKQALSYVNAQAPVTSLTSSQVPYNLLMDFTKVNLYLAKASRETMDNFTYNDIGKSFGVDRAPKLLQLAGELKRSAEAQLLLWKKNIRPNAMGLSTRYARRGLTSTRAGFIQRIVYRNFAFGGLT